MKLTYSLMDVLMASDSEPMPEAYRRHQLTRMWEGLRAMEVADKPNSDDWRVCSDAVNMLETIIDMGHMRDESGLLDDATKALAEAGKRAVKGATIRLDARGIQAVRAVLEDYRDALEALPHRVVVQAHRLTEKRIREIHAGKRRPHDVEVIAI